MVIVQAPLRVSLAGGGTDLAAYYRRQSGCVISTAIDKYVYVMVKPRFEPGIQLSYTRTEQVADVAELEHELARAALQYVGITQGVELAIWADIPAEGSGLGSSSAVTVALLLALTTLQGQHLTPEALARAACALEIEVLGKPIGKQDQYISAYGGLQRITFLPDESVLVEPIVLPLDPLTTLSRSLLLFYTGITRRSETILSEVQTNFTEKLPVFDQLRHQTDTLYAALLAGEWEHLGAVLHQGWSQKKKLAARISSATLDSYYETARAAGALGGKLTGAGGGGFLLLYCLPEYQSAVRLALAGLRELPIGLEPAGARVLHNDPQAKPFCRMRQGQGLSYPGKTF